MLKIKPSADPIKLLPDTEESSPTIEFQQLGATISGMIIGSSTNYVIGIYGDWGTGKSTLMKFIQNEYLIEKHISSTWFNAWSYERDDARATLPLMLEIIDALFRLLEKNQNETFWKKTKDKVITFIKHCNFSFGFSFLADFEIEYNPNNDNHLEKIPVPTIQTGIKLIKEMIIKIQEKIDPNFKLVVFIDDLDRCSSKNVLEVFESIKVLLHIPGLVYVVGLNYVTTTKLIDKEYEGSGIKGVDYIKKIIQIQVWLPSWNSINIEDLIENNILPEIDRIAYRRMIQEKKDTMLIAIKSNPRELKRFLNSFLFYFEIYKKKTGKTFSDTPEGFRFFYAELLKFGWNEFYNIFTSKGVIDRKQLNNMIEEIVEFQEDKRNEHISSWNSNHEVYSKRNIAIISKMDYSLWEFIKKIGQEFFKLEWDLYQITSEIEKKINKISNKN